jgi:methionine synthase reductase
MLQRATACCRSPFHCQLQTSKSLNNLQAACSGGRDAYDAIVRGGGSFVDVLRENKSCRPSLSCIVACLPCMQARYYSACSSPLQHPNTIHIAFSVVTQPRPGLATTHMMALATALIERSHAASALTSAAADATAAAAACPPLLLLPCVFRPTKGFSLPPSPLSCNIIMIGALQWLLCSIIVLTCVIVAGPGTGVSPFIGFMQHLDALMQQQQQQQQQSASGLSFLFFGCRNSREFLFQQELEGWVKGGVLAGLWVAYSRPGEQRCQDADADCATAAAALTLDDGSGSKTTAGQYVQHVIVQQQQVTCG